MRRNRFGVAEGRERGFGGMYGKNDELDWVDMHALASTGKKMGMKMKRNEMEIAMHEREDD